MGEPLVLVAEDERDIRELIAFTFRSAGLQVVEVPNGKEAVKKASKLKPDLILLDVRMPKMTGFEACRILKGQKSTREIPIVFLSAKEGEADIRMGLALGAEAYLVKPFAPDQLTQRIKAILVRYGKL